MFESLAEAKAHKEKELGRGDPLIYRLGDGNTFRTYTNSLAEAHISRVAAKSMVVKTLTTKFFQNGSERFKWESKASVRLVLLNFGYWSIFRVFCFCGRDE